MCLKAESTNFFLNLLSSKVDTFPKSYNPNAIKSSEDYKVFVGINNQTKAKVLNELINKFSINQMKVILTDEN